METYQQTVKAYLAYDPVPTALSIKQSLAMRLGTVSPSRVNMERKALKSLFGYLVDAGLWDHDPTTRIKSIPIRWKEREVPSPLSASTFAVLQDNIRFGVRLIPFGIIHAWRG